MHDSKLRSVFLLFCFLLGALLASSIELTADDTWPGFRGPTWDGHAPSQKLPTVWSEEQNVSWKVPVTGQGYSSPVIADGQIWLTTAVTSELTPEQKQARAEDLARFESKQLNVVGNVSLRALCFDLHSGKQLHDIEIFSVDDPETVHYTNTYASPTPIIHEGRLIAHFGSYGTAAVDCQSGSILWRNEEFHIDHENGPGSSPILWEDLAIIHFDGRDLQFVIALNVADGSLAWKTDRSGELSPIPDVKKAYCTPLIVDTPSGVELVSPGSTWVYGYDPRTGSELWKANYGELGFSTVPCPVAGNGIVYICTSFNKSKLLAVKFGGRGDVTDSHVVWTSDSQIPKKPSLLLSGQELLSCNDTGVATCFDALSGETLWRARIGGNFAASPILAGGLIYLFDQDGKGTVLQAGREHIQVAVNTLDEGCNASPAVAEDAIILRTASHLYRIEEK